MIGAAQTVLMRAMPTALPRLAGKIQSVPRQKILQRCNKINREDDQAPTHRTSDSKRNMFLSCSASCARAPPPFEGINTLSFTHDDIVLVKVSSIYCTVLGCSQLAEENEAQNGPRQGKNPKQFGLLDISAVHGTRVAHVCSPTQKSRVKSVLESWKTTENTVQIGLIIHSDPYL